MSTFKTVMTMSQNWSAEDTFTGTAHWIFFAIAAGLVSNELWLLLALPAVNTCVMNNF